MQVEIQIEFLIGMQIEMRTKCDSEAGAAKASGTALLTNQSSSALVLDAAHQMAAPAAGMPRAGGAHNLRRSLAEGPSEAGHSSSGQGAAEEHQQSPRQSLQARVSARDTDSSIRVGIFIIVLVDFHSDGKEPVLLRSGQQGVVAQVHNNGHALIKFDNMRHRKWVKTINFNKLEVVQDHAKAAVEHAEEQSSEPSGGAPVVRQRGASTHAAPLRVAAATTAGIDADATEAVGDPRVRSPQRLRHTVFSARGAGAGIAEGKRAIERAGAEGVADEPLAQARHDRELLRLRQEHEDELERLRVEHAQILDGQMRQMRQLQGSFAEEARRGGEEVVSLKGLLAHEQATRAGADERVQAAEEEVLRLKGENARLQTLLAHEQAARAGADERAQVAEEEALRLRGELTQQQAARAGADKQAQAAEEEALMLKRELAQAQATRAGADERVQAAAKDLGMCRKSIKGQEVGVQ